jgi:hypothetical protein
MLRLCVYASLGILWFSPGFSQTLSFNRHPSVAFTPSQKDYIEALLCQGCNSLEPFVVQGLELVGTEAQGLNLQVRRNPYLPNGQIILEARYDVFDSQDNFLESTDWLEIGLQPQILFLSKASDLQVSINYRLVITGQELAGIYQTSLIYTLGAATLQQDISIQIPSVTLLKIAQKVVSGTTTISFNYQGPEAVDYVRAIQNSTPLPLTGSNLEAIEVFSNHPRGYTVTLKLYALRSPGTLDLRLFNKPIDGQSLQGSFPTRGFQPLISEENFSLMVDGSEEPGDYQFTLEYNVQSNP